MPLDLHLDSNMIINVQLCHWPKCLCPLRSSVNNMRAVAWENAESHYGSHCSGLLPISSLKQHHLPSPIGPQPPKADAHKHACMCMHTHAHIKPLVFSIRPFSVARSSVSSALMQTGSGSPPARVWGRERDQFWSIYRWGKTNKELHRDLAVQYMCCACTRVCAHVPLRFEEVSVWYVCIMCSMGFGRHAMGHIGLLSRRCN